MNTSIGTHDKTVLVTGATGNQGGANDCHMAQTAGMQQRVNAPPKSSAASVQRLSAATTVGHGVCPRSRLLGRRGEIRVRDHPTTSVGRSVYREPGRPGGYRRRGRRRRSASVSRCWPDRGGAASTSRAM